MFMWQLPHVKHFSAKNSKIAISFIQFTLELFSENQKKNCESFLINLVYNLV